MPPADRTAISLRLPTETLKQIDDVLPKLSELVGTPISREQFIRVLLRRALTAKLYEGAFGL
jgi:hypothetical protein